jgi:hypothetical protein
LEQLKEWRMDEHKVDILSNLKEIADEYGITCIISENDQFVSFHKAETGFCDPSFSLFIEWDVCKVNVMNLNKTFSLDKIDGYARLMCEVIS